MNFNCVCLRVQRFFLLGNLKNNIRKQVGFNIRNKKLPQNKMVIGCKWVSKTEH